VALVPVIHLESYVNGLDADTAATAAGIRAGTNATLTYVVTNPGGVALTNVTVVDDNGTTGTTSDDFSPTYVSGDTNGNLALEPGEIWTFSATRPIRYGLTASMPAVSGRSIADANVSRDRRRSDFRGRVGECGRVGDRSVVREQRADR
jgi:hypothetical protein